MNDCIVFALKITGTNLDEINPIDLAIALQSFCKMLGHEGLMFDEIRSGSAYIQVRSDAGLRDEKLQHFQHSVASESNGYRELQTILGKHPAWSMEMLVKSGSDEMRIHEFVRQEKGFTFWQHENLRGHVVKLQAGKDSTYHAGLLLDDGRTIPMACSGELSKQLAQHWKSECIIEVHGNAKYLYHSFNNIQLQDFKAESFVVLDTLSPAAWLKGFAGAGDSQWSSIDDPVQHWLAERRS